MIWLSFLIVFVAYGVEEPEPINDEERNDEVAQAQTRARMLACLATARSKLIMDQESVEAVLSASVHDKEETRKKIVASIVYRCYNKIDWRVAEELLADDHVDLTRADLADVVSVNPGDFGAGTSVAWTKEEQELIDAIKFEMNRTDDGFDQEPPMVEGYDPADYVTTDAGVSSESVTYLAFGAAALLFAAMCFFLYKKMFTKPVTRREAKTIKQQGRNKKKSN
jgi:hypothetical protein